MAGEYSVAYSMGEFDSAGKKCFMQETQREAAKSGVGFSYISEYR